MESMEKFCSEEWKLKAGHIIGKEGNDDCRSAKISVVSAEIPKFRPKLRDGQYQFACIGKNLYRSTQGVDP